MTENNKDKQPISWVEKFYSGLSDKDKQQFPDAAKVMIQTGAAQGPELDFILDKFPGLTTDWVEANPDVQSIMADFRGKGSLRWLSWALVRTHHLNFNHIYHALKHSPIRPFLGDCTVDQVRPFWGDDHRVNVRVVEHTDVDLSDLKRGFYIEQDFDRFSLDSHGYLASLQSRIAEETDEKQRKVLQQVAGFYQQVMDLSFPSLRPQLFDVLGRPMRDKSGKEILFPSDHQKAAIVRATQEGSLAIFDGTGSGKTGIGVGLAEYTGSERVLVICPASVKNTWEGRIREYYVTDPGVIKINSNDKRKVANGEKYTIVNYELLINRRRRGNTVQSETLSAVAQRLLDTSFDLLIVDEGHYINNPSKRSEAVIELARRINRRLILTATPIRNSVDDIARIAHLLAPDEFVTPDALHKLGPSGVSALCELLGTKTLRRKTEDLLELPPFCPEGEGEIDYTKVELNPTQRVIYDAIYDDLSLDLLSKIKLLRLAAIDHNLVRGGKYKEGSYQIPFEERQAARELEKSYKVWRKHQDRGKEIPFNSDFLATYGFKHLLVGAHLYYKKGIDQLIRDHGSEKTQAVWQGVAESTKFKKVKEMIKDRLTGGEKVVVYSGHFSKGILREIVDDVTGEAIMEDLYSYLRREFPDVGIGRIDGQLSPNAKNGKVSARDKERQRWQDNPDFKILLTTVPSASLGVDFTINDGVTTGVDIVGIDLPYTHADFWQMVSRVYRFGQLTPVHVQVVEAVNTIDVGIHGLVDKKEEIQQELLDGVTPDEFARRLFDHSKEKSILVDYITSPKKELERMMYTMRGRGISVNGAYLETVLADGKTVGETIAELYSKYWEYTYSGHTARLVQQMVDGLRANQTAKFNLIVDAGSGPLVLERTMKQESEHNEDLKIVSVDMNKHMLENGISELERLGYPVDRAAVLNKPMSETKLKAASCDAVVCSLAFHYSNSAEDRGKILTEANRILRPDGYYIITLPEGYLTLDQYRAFTKTLRKFGFEVDKNISGKAKALDHKEVPYAIWLIAARKVAAPINDSISMEEFRFNFEGPKISRYKGDADSGDDNDKKNKDQERLVKHEEFTILDPDNGFKPKGSPTEVLTRLGLGFDEEKLKRYGWQVDIQQKDGKTRVVIKK